MNTQSVIGTSVGTGAITTKTNELNGHSVYKLENKSIMFTRVEITSFIIILKFLDLPKFRMILGDSTVYNFHAGSNIFVHHIQILLCGIIYG